MAQSNGFFDFNVQDWYAQAVREGWPQSKIEEYIETHGPTFRGQGLNPDNWDPVSNTYTSNEKVTLPVQGPAHWTGIWIDKEHVGEDHLKDISDDKPFILDQMQWLANIKDGMFTDIEFIEYIASGAYGAVWVVSVTYREPIGKGGVGAQRVTHNMCKACKVIQFPTDVSLVKGVADIMNEFSITEGLKHDNINSIDDCIPVPDTGTRFPYATVLLFMDLCQGDLNDILKSSQYCLKLTPLACKRWFRQIATGMQYLHRNHVAHVDTNLSNILYRLAPGVPDREITFRLSDFGGSIDKVKEDELWNYQMDVQHLGMCLFKSYCGPFTPNDDDPIPEQIAQVFQTENLVKLWPLEEHRDQALGDLIKALTPYDIMLTIDDVLSHPWLHMIGL